MMRSKVELSSGYKLVPWSSWDQWSFVKDSIFSSSPDSVAAALKKISAWRSRGCLPVPIDVTAAIIEIQQKDPFFREGPMDDALSSEEMLAMLYCMAIMRLVNGFVEPSHKKTGRSISELADAVGIPRMLVDIRHESSHRDLPSLRLVRMASIKALDWLKSSYWEPQRNAIPDIRKEIRSRLREMIYHLKTKHAQRLSSQIKGKRAKRPVLLWGCNKLSSQITGKLRSYKSDGFEKQISRISKVIVRLYSAYPTVVVSVLLEFFQLQEPDFSDDSDMEHSDNSDDGDPGPVRGSMSNLKTIITILYSRKPRLLLSILKTVLEMIEVKESITYERSEYNFLSSEYQARTCQIESLCSLVRWLLQNLKTLKDSGRIVVSDETQVPSTDENAAPKVSLTKLLLKCLTLSVVGSKHLSDSVLLLAEMIGSHSLSKKLEKLPLLRWEDHGFAEDSTTPHTESMLYLEDDSIRRATEKLEYLKLRLRNRSTKCSAPLDSSTDSTSGSWTVARSWIPCPIGMLPCSFSSTSLLPDLDKVSDRLETGKIGVRIDRAEVHDVPETRAAACDDVSLENGSAVKKLKPSPEEQRLDTPMTASPMEGRLLIGGVWKKVSEEEVLAVESNLRIFV